MHRALEIAAQGVVLAIAAFALVVVGYLGGSFLLMAAHTERRPFGASLRAILREATLVILTQPLLPLYYLIGRRMGGAVRDAADGLRAVPVVFVHGYMQNRVGFVALARALARRGLGPLYGFNYPWWAALDANVRRLERFVAQVCDETRAPAVDLVCHSMGGLVAMEMMRRTAASAEVPLRVRRCVTIATPHAGIAWRGPIFGIGAANLRRGSKLLAEHAGHVLSVPCLSVYSSHDNIVHPKSTSQLSARGGRDVEVAGAGHLAILFAPDVADHVAAFLAE